MKECAEREAAEKREAEYTAIRAANEKEKLERAMTGSMLQYRKFTWDEIVSATSSFSEDLRIGMGAFGTVYKCSLYHTTVAVKVLRSKESHNSKQFQQEVWKLYRHKPFNIIKEQMNCVTDVILILQVIYFHIALVESFCKYDSSMYNFIKTVSLRLILQHYFHFLVMEYLTEFDLTSGSICFLYKMQN